MYCSNIYIYIYIYIPVYIVCKGLCVCLSACLSVCEVMLLLPNGYLNHHNIFTVYLGQRWESIDQVLFWGMSVRKENNNSNVRL